MGYLIRFILGLYVQFYVAHTQASHCPLPKEFTLCQCNGQIQLSPQSDTSPSTRLIPEKMGDLDKGTSIVRLIVCQYVPLTKVLTEFRKYHVTLESILALTLTYADMEYIKGEQFKGMKLRALHLNNNKIRNMSADSLTALSDSLELLDLRINRLKWVPVEALSPLARLSTLDLAYNSIGQLKARDFAGLKALNRLHLESNEITKIAPGAFKGLQDSLLELELQNNQMKVIPADSFADLRSLKKLDLARNLVEMLSRNAFSHLVSLESLNLGHNHVKSIEGTAFQGLGGSLRVLFLHNNQIERATRENFKHLKSVEYLVLGANGIRNLPNQCFLDMVALRTLNLENNKIATINDEAFMGLENSLTYLHLPGNLLSAVPTKAIKDLKNLWVLNLGENVIHDLSANDFEGSSLKKVLGTLYLNGNLLVKVPEQAISGFETLWLLDLSDNEIAWIKNGSFKDLPALEVLNLEGNKVRLIEPAAFVGLESSVKKIRLGTNSLLRIPVEPFVHLENLRSLDFDGNKIGRIEALDTYALKDLKGEVHTLALAGNRIESLGTGSFTDLEPSLTAVDLSRNKLRVLETSTFANSGGVTIINLSHNLIETIQKDAFVDMINLKSLNLSHNHLQDLNPHMFKGMPYLTTLDLGHNQLISLQSLIFKFTSELEFLDLSSNNLTYISGHALAGLARMKDFRLSNNKLLTLEYGTFNRFTFNKLTNVDMWNNPWICDCRLRWLREWMSELMSFKGRASHSVSSLNQNLQNVVCYGPHHLMNSCLLCVPPEAYVCPDPEKYSGLILLPGPRGRKLGAKNEQFSWLVRARRERWTRSLIIVLATLLALCLAIILSMSILICRSNMRKNNHPRVPSHRTEPGGGKSGSRLPDSGSKAKLLNTADSINLGTSDIRGIGMSEVGPATGRKVSLTSMNELDYIDTLPQQLFRSDYGMASSEAGSSNEFLKTLELGCIPRGPFSDRNLNATIVGGEAKSPLYENITTQSSINSASGVSVFHQYSVPNLASSSSGHFVPPDFRKNNDIQRGKVVIKNNIGHLPQYHQHYKQYSIVSQDDPDASGIILNGKPAQLLTDLEGDLTKAPRPNSRGIKTNICNNILSKQAIRSNVKVINKSVERFEQNKVLRGTTDLPIPESDKSNNDYPKFRSGSIISDNFSPNNLMAKNQAGFNPNLNHYIYPELYPIPPNIDPTTLLDIDHGNTQKIPV